MHKIREYMSHIVDSNDKHKMEMLENTILDLFSDIKHSHEDLYEAYKMSIYEIAYDCELGEDMAHEWVDDMEPIGEHWTMEQTTNAMHNLGYNLNPVEFYVASNMMINDYYDTLKDHEEMALKMAKEFIIDTDANEHKLYKYWKYIARR